MCLTKKLFNGDAEGMKSNKVREVQTKLMRGLLDFIVLQFLKTNPMHGYQIITTLRKKFGVYFGPSTIYPLLCVLEERGYITSQWNLDNQRPRKVYNITPQGSDILNCTEESLTQLYRKLTIGFGKMLVTNNHKESIPTQPEFGRGFNFNRK